MRRVICSVSIDMRQLMFATRVFEEVKTLLLGVFAVCLARGCHRVSSRFYFAFCGVARYLAPGWSPERCS